MPKAKSKRNNAAPSSSRQRRFSREKKIKSGTKKTKPTSQKFAGKNAIIPRKADKIGRCIEHIIANPSKLDKLLYLIYNIPILK